MCQGLGNIACETCQGRGQVKAYLEVTSEIRVEESKDIVEAGGMRREYLQLLNGEIVYQYVFASLCFIRLERKDRVWRRESPIPMKS